MGDASPSPDDASPQLTTITALNEHHGCYEFVFTRQHIARHGTFHEMVFPSVAITRCIDQVTIRSFRKPNDKVEIQKHGIVVRKDFGHGNAIADSCISGRASICVNLFVPRHLW